VNQLAHTLIKWGTNSFDDAFDWVNFLSEKSVAVLDKAIQEQQKFEKEVREAVNVEEIKKPSSPEEPDTEG
jgi:uroporphyrinogen-III synthase